MSFKRYTIRVLVRAYAAIGPRSETALSCSIFSLHLHSPDKTIGFDRITLKHFHLVRDNLRYDKCVTKCTRHVRNTANTCSINK